MSILTQINRIVGEVGSQTNLLGRIKAALETELSGNDGGSEGNQPANPSASPIEQNTVELQSILGMVEDLLEEGCGQKEEQVVDYPPITQNGDYEITPDEGKVMSQVNVSVDVPSRYNEGFDVGFQSGYDEGHDAGYDEGYQKGYSDNEPVLIPLTVTTNDEFTPIQGIDGYSKVTVAVKNVDSVGGWNFAVTNSTDTPSVEKPTITMCI